MATQNTMPIIVNIFIQKQPKTHTALPAMFDSISPSYLNTAVSALDGSSRSNDDTFPAASLAAANRRTCIVMAPTSGMMMDG